MKRHTTSISNKKELFNNQIIAYALGTVLTGIGIAQAIKSGNTYLCLGFTGIGIGIKGYAGGSAIKTYLNQHTQKQEKERQLNGSRADLKRRIDEGKKQ